METQQEYNQEDFLLPYNMIRLYAMGAFPMADPENGDKIDWFMPEKRAIIPIDAYNVPRSLRKHIEKTEFRIEIDRDFESVVKNCAKREETWISEKLIKAYFNLYAINHIHTVEVYQENKLVGGLYGITYHGAFFGESMFSEVSQASKIALVKLLEHLRKKGFVLLDIQFMTDHLEMFGAIEIPFEEYEELLQKAYATPVEF